MIHNTANPSAFASLSLTATSTLVGRAALGCRHPTANRNPLIRFVSLRSIWTVTVMPTPCGQSALVCVAASDDPLTCEFIFIYPCGNCSPLDSVLIDCRYSVISLLYPAKPLAIVCFSVSASGREHQTLSSLTHQIDA